ncbi:MAG: AI-2E family transporter [Coriobacteriia bacterium]|nr:AI-2E family transporter [Coriobacteriia bacterium]
MPDKPAITDKPAESIARTERTKRLFYLVWAVIGIIALVIGIGYVLGQIMTALAIMALSAFIVFILRVPVAWMERKGIHRLPGSLIAYLGGILIVTVILLIFIPLITRQIIGLIQLIPGYVNSATNSFNYFYQEYSYLLEDSNIQQLVGGVASDLSGWAADIVSQSALGAINLGMSLVTALIVLTVSLIVGFWILKDLPRIGKELRIIMGPKWEKDVLFISSTFSRAFGGYLRGMTISGTCTGIIAGVGYYFLGLPYPAVLGLLVGLMNFIPYVGPWIAGIVVAAIGIFVSPLVALISILVTIFAEQFVDNFIYPRVMSSVVDLHPAVVLVGVFTGGALGGAIGLISAVPLLSAAKAIYVYYFEKRTGRTLENEKGAIFKTPHTRHKKKGAAAASSEEGESQGEIREE